MNNLNFKQSNPQVILYDGSKLDKKDIHDLKISKSTITTYGTSGSKMASRTETRYKLYVIDNDGGDHLIFETGLFLEIQNYKANLNNALIGHCKNIKIVTPPMKHNEEQHLRSNIQTALKNRPDLTAEQLAERVGCKIEDVQRVLLMVNRSKGISNSKHMKV